MNRWVCSLLCLMGIQQVACSQKGSSAIRQVCSQAKKASMSTWSQVRVRSRVASRARILASIALQGSNQYDQCTGQALRTQSHMECATWLGPQPLSCARA